MITVSEHTFITNELSKIMTSYEAAKAQSQILDEFIGFNCPSIENELFLKTKSENHFKEKQFWFGLDIQSLQTPYSELVEMVTYLNPKDNDLWIDLGAAYGRMGVTLGFLKPKVTFIGFEFISARVIEGNRIYKHLSLKNSHLKEMDIATQDFKLQLADVYFVYDFGSKRDVMDILEKLRKISLEQPIKVIARGRGIKNWIYQTSPWLYDMKPQIHFENWSLFQS
ncbi:MAG: hypothetical protein L6Q37_03450 [Bdellovibrionaceae bacterium]|nr:hypothetical protein [Pseudobdellovibrionaceae bacterium]NUM60208.1 hypothetical protein [Pseudobdellovibrionaceae bacterium]